MRFRQTVYVVAMCLFGGYATAQLIYPGVLSWGANTVFAPNGLPALALDAGPLLIDAGTKWADGGPNCAFTGYVWEDAGGYYTCSLGSDGGFLPDAGFLYDAGYFCDAGINDAGPVLYWYFGNYYDGGPWSDGGLICYDTVGDGGPWQDAGPAQCDGGPVVRVDAGVNFACVPLDAGASAYINADGGTIVADGGPWLISQVVAVGDNSNLTVVCSAFGADPEPAGNIQIQGSNDGQQWFLLSVAAPFDAGASGVYAWTIGGNQQPWPLVRVAVLNANDAGVLQCSMWAQNSGL